MKPALLALLVVLVVLPLTVASQAPIFRASVSVVRFDVLVTDNGRPVPGLGAADFDVRDNGTLQRVDVAPGDRDPVDVLLVFDHSGSTQGPTLQRLRESALAVLDTLGASDRAGLMVFNHRLGFDVPFGEHERLRQEVRTLEAESSTALLDAVSAAFTVSGGNTRRTVILLFTDGTDTLSWMPEDLVLQQARSADAVLYVVAMRPRDVSYREVERSDAQLRALSEGSGGRLLRASGPEQLRARFLEVLEEMRARYVLTYAATDGDRPGWHEVSVRLKRRAGRVTARAGYTVPAAP